MAGELRQTAHMGHDRTRSSGFAGLLLVGTLTSCVATDDLDPAPASEHAVSERAGAASDRDAIALTTEGFVRGIVTDTTREFRGIPYAAAPVGDLRWRPPQRRARWTTTLDATQFANHCPQSAGVFGRASDTEDCLFLNVFVPRARAHGLRPVMVWIHGGGLVTGESDDYDAARLAAQGNVVVVTINYRLGALGFLAHPALTTESADHASGNYGLMDQQEALRWVRRNIFLLGGDPFRVTIFGESAGGLSVHAQLASPAAHGLFQRAIVQSGAYQLTQPSLAAAEAAGTAFAAGAGCADPSAACLRAVAVAQLLATQAAGLGAATPVIDGKVLTQSIAAAFATGQFNRVPVVEGSNRDESRIFVALAELVNGPLPADAYPAAVQATLGIPAAVVPLVIAQYPLAAFPSPALALSALATDATFACNARFAAQQLSKFVPTFAYEFNDPRAPQPLLPPVSFPYGAYHGAEILYLFTVPAVVPTPPFDAAQQRLSDTMIDYWATFARTGQPSSFRTPLWARFQTDRDAVQALVPTLPRPDDGFAVDHECAFWDRLRS
jgi:para-nitrobenzyl esterase